MERSHHLLPPLLTPLLGVAVWALLFLSPLQIEWGAQDTRGILLAAFLAPLGALGLGVALRRPLPLLLGFPVSILPGFLLMPELDRAIFSAPGPALLLLGALGGFVVAASRWLARAPHPGRDGAALEASPLPPLPQRRDLWWPYRVHFAPRLLLLPLLLALPIYRLNFAAGALEAWREGFGEQAAHAQVMANLLALFVWVVVAYLFFISPGLNLELEQRELDQQLAARALRRPGAASRALVWALAILGAACAGGALLYLKLG